jgi:hypothetical protein
MLCASASAGALAAPCAGFNDVDTANPLCGSVEWIRNRGITLGCTATAFCPNDNVTRLQMAAFLHRLGTALTPQQLVVEGVLPAPQLDLDAAPVVCGTSSPFQVASYPRRAIIDLSVGAQAASALDVTAVPVVTFDNGATWTPLATLAGRSSVAPGQWGHVAAVATRDLDVGQTVRFGARLSRAAGGGDLTAGACQLRVQLVSRDGAASPF